MTLRYDLPFLLAGGCHVILVRCVTGAEPRLEVESVHGEWPTRAQIPVRRVAVTRMILYGARTAVFLPINLHFKELRFGDKGTCYDGTDEKGWMNDNFIYTRLKTSL